MDKVFPKFLLKSPILDKEIGDLGASNPQKSGRSYVGASGGLDERSYQKKYSNKKQRRDEACNNCIAS